MKSLILDYHAQLPWWRRLMRGTVTALGWALWAYLWLPLLDSLHGGPGVDARLATTVDLMAHPLLATLRWHALMILAVGSLFVALSFLQGYEQRRRSAVQPPRITFRHLARSIRLSEEDLAEWQRAPRVVVQHDEGSGWIRSVVCADALLPLDDPSAGQRKRFIPLLHK